jgi:hypothetical protein
MRLLDYLTSRLAPLASERYQELYGRNATVAECLVPSELLESASECVDKLEARYPLAEQLNAEAQSLNPQAKAELQKLATLLRSAERAPLEDMSWPELLNNSTWLTMRAHARSTLAALGFDIAAWEASEVRGQNVP